VRGITTKENIDRAALRLFLRRGVDGTSMRDIVKEAGISLGAFYNHYPSKEELAWALFSEEWSGIAVEMRRRARAQKTLRGRLLAIVGYVFGLFDQDPDQVGYVFFSRHLHLRQVNVRLPSPHIVIRLFLTNAIAQGEAQKIDPELATQVVMGVVIQIIDARMLNLIKGPLATRAEAVADILYRMLRA
jgi:AcrR family transcriptional regulator